MMNIDHVILYAIVPVFVVMLAGYIAGRRGVFGGEDAKRFNKVVLDFALPAALFVSIVRASRDMLVADIGVSLAALTAVMGCFMLVYFLFSRCFRDRNGASGALMALTAGSPAIGFLGFAVLQPIFGETPEVALMVAIVGIVVNAVGIPVGLSLLNASVGCAGTGKGSAGWWRPVVAALRKPVAWAPILAVIWVAAGIPWPQWASPSLDLIAKANASLAVFSAGVSLSVVKLTLDRRCLIGTVFKLVVMPAMALLAGHAFGLGRGALEMLVCAAALPPAFTGIMISDEYGRCQRETTSTLMLSMILFMPACPIWLLLAGMSAG